MSFSVEHEHDSTIITVLDVTGSVEDLQVILDDRWVYLRQFNETTGCYEVLKVRDEMMREFFTAINKPEGMYV